VKIECAVTVEIEETTGFFPGRAVDHLLPVPVPVYFSENGAGGI
jgi:hypothetical protein